MDYLQDIFYGVHFNPIGFGEIFSAVLACLLLIASGFASGSEIAFFSLSPNDLNELDEEKNKADGYVKRLRNDSERTLATILITNNLVNVTIIMLCNFFFSRLLSFDEGAEYATSGVYRVERRTKHEKETFGKWYDRFNGVNIRNRYRR